MRILRVWPGFVRGCYGMVWYGMVAAARVLSRGSVGSLAWVAGAVSASHYLCYGVTVLL